MLVKLVTAKSTGATNYHPEIGFVRFLDKEYPADAPHSIYASYARSWTIKKLHEFLTHVVKRHSIDAVIAFDGGN